MVIMLLLESIQLLVVAIMAVTALSAVTIALVRLVMPRPFFVTIAYSHFCETYAARDEHTSLLAMNTPGG